jgi:ribokinase
VAASRAGSRVVFVGARGEDEFGAAAAAALKRENIDIRHFKAHKNVSSGVALILLGGRNRENVIYVSQSANDLFSAETVQAALSEFAKSGVVVTQLEVPLGAVKEAAKIARETESRFFSTRLPHASCRGACFVWCTL